MIVLTESPDHFVTSIFKFQHITNMAIEGNVQCTVINFQVLISMLTWKGCNMLKFA